MIQENKAFFDETGKSTDSEIAIMTKTVIDNVTQQDLATLRLRGAFLLEKENAVNSQLAAEITKELRDALRMQKRVLETIRRTRTTLEKFNIEEANFFATQLEEISAFLLFATQENQHIQFNQTILVNKAIFRCNQRFLNLSNILKNCEVVVVRTDFLSLSARRKINCP